MTPYEKNRPWSDTYMHKVAQILKPYFGTVTIASDTMDVQYATDLISTDGTRIAVRCRRPGYAQRYPYDITIRYAVPSGVRTESAKISEGNADYMIYCHVGDDDTIVLWHIIDLRKFRQKNVLGEILKNTDGSIFIAYDLRKCPAIVMASSCENFKK